MPRQARLAIADIPWHIIQRGNNRSPCFFAEQDYRRYLVYLRELSCEHACRVHAFVLMTNHVHLLLTPAWPEGPSALMKQLGQRYVQYVNRNYGRTGTLWEGRFRSCLVQSANYVLACYRYIETNPVRAHMVAHPADYPWSSYRANGEGAASEIISPHGEYEALGESGIERRRAYQALFAGRIDIRVTDEIRAATNGNHALGDDRFKADVARMVNRRTGPGRPGRPRKTDR